MFSRVRNNESRCTLFYTIKQLLHINYSSNIFIQSAKWGNCTNLYFTSYLSRYRNYSLRPLLPFYSLRISLRCHILIFRFGIFPFILWHIIINILSKIVQITILINQIHWSLRLSHFSVGH